MEINIRHYFKIKVKYKGTNYLGWQIQVQGKTIQGEIVRALKIICKSHEVKTLGSGRTDSGVHALGQVFRADIPLSIGPQALKRALNSNLPLDIRIIEVSNCSSRFNPIIDSVWKEYIYIFTDKDIYPFSHDQVASFPYKMDFLKMGLACQLFIGEKDFTNFACTGSNVLHNRRTIYECDLVSYKSTGIWANFCEEYHIIRVRGNGFLKQMVRLMVGSLWNIGRGKIDTTQLLESLNDPGYGKVGAVAPPVGLYLKEVQYATSSSR